MFVNIQLIDWGIFLVDIFLSKYMRNFYEIFILYFISKNFLFPIFFLKNKKIIYYSRILLFLIPITVLKIKPDLDDFEFYILYLLSLIYLLIVMIIVKSKKRKKSLIVIILFYQLIIVLFYILTAIQVGEITYV